jgi:hypothetical protein
MGRLIATSIGVVCIAALAAGTTDLALIHAKPKVVAARVVARHALTTPTPSATPTLTPTPSATPAPTVTTNGFVHLRAQPTTASTDLADLQQGTVLIIEPYVDASWQEVSYNGIIGYVYRAYLTY